MKTYYKTTVIKTVQYWQRDRHNRSVEQNKTLVIDPHIHGQVIFEKGVKTIQWEKNSPHQMVFGQMDIPGSDSKNLPALCETWV